MNTIGANTAVIMKSHSRKKWKKIVKKFKQVLSKHRCSYQMKIKILNKKHKHSVIFKNKKIRCAKIQIIDSNILTHNPISLNNIKIRINIINTMTLIHSNKSNRKISTSTTNLIIHKIILNHL